MFDYYFNAITFRESLRQAREVILQLAFDDALSVEAIELRAAMGWPPIQLYGVRMEGMRIQRITTGEKQ